MFAIKKTRTTGKCSAMRCTEDAKDLLCARHEAEWQEAGAPPLTRDVASAVGSASKGDALAPIEAKLTTARHEAQLELAAIAQLPSETEEDAALLAAYVNAASAKIKELDDERKSAVGPLNATVKKINGWFSPVIEFYTQAKSMCGSKLSERVKRLEAEQTAALVEIQANAGNADAGTYLAAHATPQTPAGVQVRRKLKWRVVDFSKIPEHFLTMVVHEAVVQGQIDQTGLQTSIPGIEVYEDITIVSGRSA
jgi:hypothetical protein